MLAPQKAPAAWGERQEEDNRIEAKEEAIGNSKIFLPSENLKVTAAQHRTFRARLKEELADLRTEAPNRPRQKVAMDLRPVFPRDLQDNCYKATNSSGARKKS